MGEKYAFVSGAAHRLGKAIAIGLAKQHYNIIIHYNSSQEAAEVTKKEILAFGVSAFLVQANLSILDELDLMVKEVKKITSHVDVIVNSAASFVKQKFLDVTADSWDKALDINLKAPFFIVQNFLPLLELSENPVVINIADHSGTDPWLQFIQHGISKAGLIHMTKILGRELAPKIRVNAIVPGPILPPPFMGSDNPKWKSMVAKIPLQRSEGTKPIIDAIAFIIDNSFVTGSILSIDGGEGLIGSINH